MVSVGPRVPLPSEKVAVSVNFRGRILLRRYLEFTAGLRGLCFFPLQGLYRVF